MNKKIPESWGRGAIALTLINLVIGNFPRSVIWPIFSWLDNLSGGWGGLSLYLYICVVIPLIALIVFVYIWEKITKQWRERNVFLVAWIASFLFLHILPFISEKREYRLIMPDFVANVFRYIAETALHVISFGEYWPGGWSAVFWGFFFEIMVYTTVAPILVGCLFLLLNKIFQKIKSLA